MVCPSCNGTTRVLESRRADDGRATRRRRECPACGRRFTTFERIERGPLYVIKRDGERQPFDRAKLRRALVRAAHKRPVTGGQIDAAVGRVQALLEADGDEHEAQAIAELALAELRELDYGAYLQFAGTLTDVNPEFAGVREAGSVRPEEDRSSFPAGSL